ncbi:hypothetical protein [Actinophytocola sp. NPDC049390]|uniref:hypothetical protein n=1 Tax=Actinophytocola sp. NPDC049390 TaxID=3363894 RepID=UPI00379A39D4
MNYPPNQYPSGRRNVVAPVLVVVIAALIGLGILGFVNPGFFLGDDNDSSASSEDSGDSGDTGAATEEDGTEQAPKAGEPERSEPGDEPGDEPTADPTADPAGYLNAFLDAVYERDLGKIRDLSCGEIDGGQTSVQRLLDDSKAVPLSLIDPDALLVTDSTIDGQFEGYEEERGPITGLVGGREVDDRWCVDTFSW